MAKIFPVNCKQKHESMELIKTLQVLSKLQSMAKAKYLTDIEATQFRGYVEELKDCYKQVSIFVKLKVLSYLSTKIHRNFTGFVTT